MGPTSLRRLALGALLLALAVVGCSQDSDQARDDAAPETTHGPGGTSSAVEPTPTEESESAHPPSDTFTPSEPTPTTQPPTSPAASPTEERSPGRNGSKDGTFTISGHDKKVSHTCTEGQGISVLAENIELTLTGPCGGVVINGSNSGVYIAQATSLTMTQESRNTSVYCEARIADVTNLGSANLLMKCRS